MQKGLPGNRSDMKLLTDTVGARSFGRGQIQTYVALGDNAGLITPVATVDSPHGTRFGHESGLIPDISVPAAGGPKRRQ
jgi:C-terminal processing protease CtpA/Prc